MWENVHPITNQEQTLRLKVQGGWLVKVVDATLRPATIALCYIPDPEYAWVLT